MNIDMLKKYYQAQKDRELNNIDLIIPTEESIKTWKFLKLVYNNIPFFTKAIDTFSNLNKEDIFRLMNEQEELAKKEANIFLKYSFLNKVNYDKTLDQYRDLFFYEWVAFLKSHIIEYLNRETEVDMTYFRNNYKSPEEIAIENKQKEDLLKQKWINVVSRSWIRSLTWYSPYVIPKWSKTWESFFIKWQFDLLEDPNKLICVEWSRQIWKSYTLSERLIEESFIPNNDWLVWAFIVKTTNVIRNNIMKLTKKFPKWKFELHKAEWYIQNMQTWSKIYFMTLSNWADNVRWLTLNWIIIDEAQLVDNDVFEEVLEPTISTTDWSMILIWTPGKKRTWYYYETMMRIKSWLQEWSLYQIDIHKNPLIWPVKRAKILANQDKPSIQRERFCKWTSWWDQIVEIPLFSWDIEIIPTWHIVLWIDPARPWIDRSAYCICYVNNWKIVILFSGEVPKSQKRKWKTQVEFYQTSIIPKFRQFKSFKKIMDVTWIWDWACEIFEQEWLKIDVKNRYVAWWNISKDWTKFKTWKSYLINVTKNLVEEWFVEIIETTNKELIFEISQINEIKIESSQQLAIDTAYHDDYFNALMLCLLLIQERWLLNKKWWINEEEEVKSSWSSFIDAIERRKVKKPIKRKNKNKSYW